MPLGLKAEPCADAAWPGVFGAVGLPQLWFGWPVRRVVAVVLVVVVGFDTVETLGGVLTLKGARAIGGGARIQPIAFPEAPVEFSGAFPKGRAIACARQVGICRAGETC